MPDALSISYLIGSPPIGTSMMTLTSCGGFTPTGIFARSMRPLPAASAIHHLPQPRRRQRQVAHLDAERLERRRYRVRHGRRHRHHTAFPCPLGAERVGLGAPELHGDGADI